MKDYRAIDENVIVHSLELNESDFSMSGKGNSITLPEKEMVVHIKHYFDQEKHRYAHHKEWSFTSAVSRTALATNRSEMTVTRIMAEYHTGKQ